MECVQIANYCLCSCWLTSALLSTKHTVNATVCLVAGAPPTLQGLGSVLLDHDAELQHQLRRRLQERLQQAQHVDIGVLEHHSPVPPPLVLLLPPRHHPQVEGSDVPAGDIGNQSDLLGGVDLAGPALIFQGKGRSHELQPGL